MFCAVWPLGGCMLQTKASNAPFVLALFDSLKGMFLSQVCSTLNVHKNTCTPSNNNLHMH
jgi:hypothetical protein